MSMSDPDLDPRLADTRPGPHVRQRMPSPPDPPVRHRALHPVETMGDVTLGLATVAAAVLVDASSSGVGIGLTIAVLSFTVWFSFAEVANRVTLRRRDVRWSLMVTAVAGIAMAVATPGVMAGSGIVYAAAYWVARLALSRAVWARPEFGWGVNPYTMSAFFSGPLLIAGCVTEGDARLAIWLSAALHDVAVPVVLRSKALGLAADPEHFADRYTFGVGTMVLGGGAVLLAGAGAQAGGWAWWLSCVAVALLVASLWWAYVAVLRPAQLAPSDEPALGRQLVAYAHLSLAAGAVLALGAARLTLADPLGDGGAWVSGILFSGLLIAYGGMAGVSSWLLQRPQWPLWAGVAGSCALAVAGAFVPNVVTLCAAAAAAVAVAAVARPLLRAPRPAESRTTPLVPASS